MECEQGCDKQKRDSQLLARFVSEHDQSAFTELVHKYQRLVWSVCTRSLDRRCDVEDAFQTTFMLLSARAHRISKPESLANWIYSVAWKSASGIRRRRSLEPINDEFDVAVDSDEPFDQIARKHEIELVDRELQQLQEKFRTPLVLFYFMGYSGKQIAGQLNISVSAAEGRLRRARAELRLRLVSRGTVANPLMISVLMASACQANPACVNRTIECCLTTGAGTASAMTTSSLSIGTKLMIIKGILSLAIISILAVGGLFHTGATQPHENAVVILAQAQDSSAGTLELQLADQEKDKTKTRATRFLHQHLDQFHRHVHHLFQMFHGHVLERHAEHQHRAAQHRAAQHRNHLHDRGGNHDPAHPKHK